jgi:threonine aldolase
MPENTIDRLLQDFSFYRQLRIDDAHSTVRLVTSWATSEENADKFIKILEKL